MAADLAQHRKVRTEYAVIGRYGAGLDRCYARAGYSGIADFPNARYLRVMESSGGDAVLRFDLKSAARTTLALA